MKREINMRSDRNQANQLIENSLKEYKEMPLSKEIISEAEKRNDTAIVIIGRTAGEDQDNKADAGSYYLTQAEREARIEIYKKLHSSKI